MRDDERGEEVSTWVVAVPRADGDSVWNSCRRYTGCSITPLAYWSGSGLGHPSAFEAALNHLNSYCAQTKLPAIQRSIITHKQEAALTQSDSQGSVRELSY